MRATQQIFRVRRQYNQWVANQTLEDYALRFTAKKARRWSVELVAMTALGATAFLALEVIGGAITLHYGFINALVAMITVGLVIFITGLPISYYAAKHGVDIDLLTRGAGFGYLGSTITSLIYASFTFIFFAIEAAILALALKALFGIPLAIGYILCAVAVIPIVTHGITFISKFQVGTQPVWLALQVLALFCIAYFEADNLEQWLNYPGIAALEPINQTVNNPLSPTFNSGFNLLHFGAAASVLFALTAQIGEQVDYLRFLPPQEETTKVRWWSALILAGPGWIFIGVIKMLVGSFLAYLAFSRGASFEVATDPTQMYQRLFNYITQSPGASLILAGAMVIISQMKINVTNAYAGSIAWSNFFSRLTHSHPGRVVWLVFNVSIALLLMELGIYRALENILGMFAIIAISWLGSVAADLIINKSLGLSPPGLEFKRSQLYDINPVGVGSMIIASIIGIVCYLGTVGESLQALAHFVTLGCTFILVPLIAYLTNGHYYIARESGLDGTLQEYQCCICENSFEHEDMSHCPAYQGPICSLCCSLDGRCRDICKEDARFSIQIVKFLNTFLPASVVTLIDSRTGKFILLLAGIATLNAGMLSLIYYHISPQEIAFALILKNLLWVLHFLLMIVFGVLAWLFLLSHESRYVAQEESNRQTYLLIKEIEAHKETDLALQDAKESAEAANLAKSRYLTGISHELRTPLHSIIGYAQLLSRDPSIPEPRKESIAIMRRSGEYLADLIEGLLDISRIEAGRLDIRRSQLDLHELLDQMVLMFSQQAETKSIVFNYSRANNLPRYVMGDEKRIRQILINLLSNAIKFTHRGHVDFSVRYRNQVAEFLIKDSGVGISDHDMERIFRPFERILNPGRPQVSGTGLGLTIVRSLCDIMGGDVSAISGDGEGSQFKVRLMLSKIEAPQLLEPLQHIITGYLGTRQEVLVVDDEINHRRLIEDMLTPLGFTVIEARDAEACLQIIKDRSRQLKSIESHSNAVWQPDIFLIDVSMPGISGLDLAYVLREQYQILAPIVMISADALEDPMSHSKGSAHRNDQSSPLVEARAPYNAYLVKPIKLQDLQDQLSKLTGISWQYGNHSSESIASLAPNTTAPPASSTTALMPTDLKIPEHSEFTELLAYAEVGYAKGYREKLKHIERLDGVNPMLIDSLQQCYQQMNFDKAVRLLTRKMK